MTLYTDLGVSKTATEAQIKAAHRKAVKKAHPDAGGSPEAFERVQRAYMVLCDPQRRKHYDETGAEDEAPKNTEEQLALALVATVILEFLGGDHDLIHTDVVQKGHEALGKKRQGHVANQGQIKTRLKRVETMRDRLIRKSGDQNPIAAILDDQVRAMSLAMENEEAQIRVIDAARVILKGYSYRVDENRSGFSNINAATLNSIWSEVNAGL